MIRIFALEKMVHVSFTSNKHMHIFLYLYMLKYEYGNLKFDIQNNEY